VAPDGIVEGIESTGSNYAVGVQWHAEGMSGAIDQGRLFSSFVAAASAYERGDLHTGRAAAA
jgi:gamma-glutamyl-gamma-aminobutyrate hydrolase PuuD